MHASDKEFWKKFESLADLRLDQEGAFEYFDSFFRKTVQDGSDLRAIKQKILKSVERVTKRVHLKFLQDHDPQRIKRAEPNP